MTKQNSDETIKSRCLACKYNDSVLIGSGGYSTCSRIECPNSDFLEAWEQSALQKVKEELERIPKLVNNRNTDYTLQSHFKRQLDKEKP